ncbi:glycoside hydrolase family 127 protein [Draconibacterium sp.]|nr:glycoside hydrolase family 127 protein [Draconibacterium sp.]
MKKNRGSISFIFIIIFFISCTDLNTNISVVEYPDTSFRNKHYASNRAPLVPSRFIKLPVGAVQPEGWLKEYLVRQQNGLTGHLGEISAWLQKDRNAWLSEDGTGEWGWEEVPYWLKGYGNLGYILKDKKIIDETKIWIEAALKSQRKNGNFGPIMEPRMGIQDYWGNMIMLYCLQSYYEYSSDQRVIDLMTKYFEYQLTIPDERFLIGYWQRIRGGDNLHSVLWLYNRTGQPFLLELAEKIHRNTADWIGRDHQLSEIHNHKEIREGMEWPEWYGKQIDWHNVNHAQCFREPAQYYLLTNNGEHLKAAYENFEIMREYFGQVPGGMFGADENARPGYDDPRQGIETCGIVEQMNSDEHMLRISGDPFWADHVEEVAFNTFPAATMSNFKSLHYITSPNMVLCDAEDHSPGIDNPGPFLMMNPFSSRCCQHNHAQGWPYFAENLWMATPDNGVAATIYSANSVKVKVGYTTLVTIKEETNYPYEDEIRFALEIPNTVIFPLYLRIPGWCSNASILINNDTISVTAEAGKFVRIERKWKPDDKVTLKLPMELSVKRWEKNHNSASVQYGPLTFSLKIKEKYIQKSSIETAILDSKWQEGADADNWPSWEIHPDSDWNYGLIYDPYDLQNSFKVEKRNWPKDNFPFTHQSNPISIKAKGAKIPEWQLDEYLLCGELMDSPVSTESPVEEIELIPMGAARLRISAFPVIKK